MIKSQGKKQNFSLAYNRIRFSSVFPSEQLISVTYITFFIFLLNLHKIFTIVRSNGNINKRF